MPITQVLEWKKVSLDPPFDGEEVLFREDIGSCKKVEYVYFVSLFNKDRGTIWVPSNSQQIEMPTKSLEWARLYITANPPENPGSSKGEI